MSDNVEWNKIKNAKELIDFLIDFLYKVFKKEYIMDQYKKLKSLAPRSKPEELKYLIEPNVHRVAKWYEILHNIKNRNYSFDLRFSTDIEEFMKMLIFAYAFDNLLKHGVVSLDDSAVMGQLQDHRRGKFESFMHHVLVASNYTSHGFEVTFLDLLEEGKPDIYAKKGDLDVYAECKRLTRNDKYVEIAIEIGSWLFQEDINAIVDVTLLRTPKDEKSIKEVAKAVKKAIELGRIVKNDYVHVYVQNLPELIEWIAPVQISVPEPENIEFILSTSYFGIFDGIPKIKNPKIIILRNPNKYEEIRRRLKKVFQKANKQLESVKGRKLIYIDVSEVAGRPTLQLPELIRLNIGPEIVLGRVEEFVRNWLERHLNLDAVCLTQYSLYLDELGLPSFITWENKIVTSYVAPGWTIQTLIIPVPSNYTPELLVNRSIDLANRGLHKLAEYYYRRAIELNPNLKQAYNNLGNLLNKLGRSHEALIYLNKALEIDPQYVSALINKGIALVKLGKYNQALECFEKALNLDPNDKKGWYNKALVHAMLGQHDKALASVNKALAIDPKYRAALKLKEKLDKAKDIEEIG